ncbi:MAG TPA: hypothetical protein VN154_13415 [Rhizomicrobium sp.]|nr:hypothetical protein [Rhizomicrobium sp.]
MRLHTPLSQVSGFPAYVAEALDIVMRIDETAPKTVVFLGIKNPTGDFIPMGTAFLGLYKFEDVAFPFAITARHIVDDIQGDQVWVRYNEKSGLANATSIPKGAMWLAEDPAADLAIIPLGKLDPKVMDQQLIDLNPATWHKRTERMGKPGLGDEVATIGLYSSHYGQLKNIPVTRIGHVAMLPGEPVLTDKGYVHAYLVEVKSIAGLSGSPVFLNYPDLRRAENKTVEMLTAPAMLPLGLMLGYHVVETSQDQISVPQFQGEDPPTIFSLDERNTGFGVVLPFVDILEVWQQPVAQAHMKKIVENLRAKSGYRPAGIKIPPSRKAEAPTESPDANPSHKEDFMSLLGAAAKAKKPID